MENRKIVIAGGTGFIGHGLAKYFVKINDVIIIGRDAKRHDNNSFNTHKITRADGYNIEYLTWDGQTRGEWCKAFECAI